MTTVKGIVGKSSTSATVRKIAEGQQPPSVHEGEEKDRQNALLPAELALSKIEEVDPLHHELNDFINRQQYAYLGATEKIIMDKEFGEFLKNNEEKMSNYAGAEDHVPRGVGYKEPQTIADDKANKMRRHAKTMVGHAGASARAGGDNQKSSQDIRKALDATGWGPTTTSPTAVDAEELRRVTARQFTSRRQMENQNEFTGLGYKSSIMKYVSQRFEDAIKTTPQKTEKLGRAATKLAARGARDEIRTEPGEVTYLAMSPFQAISSSAGAAGTTSRSRPDSLYVDEDTYAIIDTGTTITITNLKDTTMLESFDKEKRVKIAGFNGSTSRSKGSGTIVGYTGATSGKTVTIRIPNAHQVDGAPHELVSVSNMIENEYEFHFTEEESYIISPEREKIILLRKSGLFWLKMKRAVGPAASAGLARIPRGKNVGQDINEFMQDEHEENKNIYRKCSTDDCQQCNLTLRAEGKTVPLQLMHQRLNHMSPDLILKMSKLGALDVNVTGKKTVCDVCRTAKATRNSVPKRRDLVDDQVEPFQRVWTDLKGKVTKDIWGNQYMITFTCEALRWTWVGFMKHKSEAKDQYLKFLRWVKLEGHKVKQLNSDGGGEYTASENAKVISEFQKISEDWGVKQNFTCAHTPEQNGVSERLNRTLVESGRALLIQAKLGAELWSLAVAHAVFIKNRMWHKRLQISENVGASPYQALYGSTPRTTNLRVWGCDAWKLDHAHRSSSWTRKASKQIFVGLSAKRKGWVLLDPKTRKISTSYHVTFDEDMAARRCALRDFDLRQTKKAGPGATTDEERVAKLERSMYDESPDLKYEDQIVAYEGHHGGNEAEAEPDERQDPDSGAEETYWKEQDDSPDSRSTRRLADESSSTPSRARTNGGAAARTTRSSSVPSRTTRSTTTPDVSPLQVPIRRAAIGAPQELVEEDMLFLRKALEINLPLVFQQRNPKLARTLSRQRYEGYKKATTLREAKKLKASWEDLVWDYGRGWIDFSAAASSNVVLNELIMNDYLREINDSPAAYANHEGFPTTADKFSGMCFEESIQQDYAMIGMEVIDSLSYRARRILDMAIGGQTLTEFAHCCASRIVIPTPLTVAEAMASEHKVQWKKAMQEEIDTLNRFHCFDVVPRAEALRHGRLVKSKWVFKVKMESDGSLQRFKARLVAKGFTQQYGVDYDVTYSSVFGYSSLRSILAKAANEDLSPAASSSKSSTRRTCSWSHPRGTRSTCLTANLQLCTASSQFTA